MPDPTPPPVVQLDASTPWPAETRCDSVFQVYAGAKSRSKLSSTKPRPML
jgi:hypothetical protein